MRIIYSKLATADRAYWEKHNPKIIQRIDELLTAIAANPSSGIGKPEALRFEFSGYWSRRINHEHRLVYKVVNDVIYIVQCRYHY